MKKQSLTKKELAALLNIARECSAEVKCRGDLAERGCDSEDFIEVSVWGIEEMLRRAYELGKSQH